MRNTDRCEAYELGPLQTHLPCVLDRGHDGQHEYDRSLIIVRPFGACPICGTKRGEVRGA